MDDSLALTRDRMTPAGTVVSPDLDSTGGRALALYDGDAPEEPSRAPMSSPTYGRERAPARYGICS